MDIRQILDFLAALRENNNRAWMEANQADYQQARGTFVKIADFLMKGIEPLDESIAGLEPRRCIFRINRDVRFSKDKSPYKTNMGAYLTKGGRHGSYAGYYLHLEPYDQSFMAGGIYQPSADALKKIRQEIDYNGDDLTKIIDTPGFRELFGSLQGEKLKRPPKGYNADHPQIEWLKMKSFLVMHPAKDRTITQKYFLSYVLDIFRNIIPFNKFLNMAINN